MEGENHDYHGEKLQDLLLRKNGAFRHVPNGIPGVETRLLLLYTGALQTGRITPQKFVELTSTNPAKLVCLLPIIMMLTSITVWPSMDCIPEREH